MNKIIILVAVVGLWFAYQNRSSSQVEEYVPNKESTTKTYTKSKVKFKCDGRQYCSQMTSCEEATFFLNNCKDPKMDGNYDGIPCEKQWCH